MPDKFSAQRHFELRAREPFGSSFLLCLVDEHGAPIAQFVLDRRLARVLYVLLAAAGLEDVDEWRGFISPEELGKRCSDFSDHEDPLALGTVRQLISQLRKLVAQEFAGVGGAPQLIETERNIGYRITPDLLRLASRRQDRLH